MAKLKKQAKPGNPYRVTDYEKNKADRDLAEFKKKGKR